MNFKGVCKSKIYNFLYFGTLDGVNGEISMNTERSMQVKAQLDRTAYRSRHGTDN